MVLDSGEGNYYGSGFMTRKWREDMKTVSPGKLVWRQHLFFFQNIMCAALTLYVHTNCWSVPIVCIGMASYRPMIYVPAYRRCIKLCLVEDLLLCQFCVECRSMKQISNPTVFAAWTKASRRPFCLYLVVENTWEMLLDMQRQGSTHPDPPVLCPPLHKDCHVSQS